MRFPTVRIWIEQVRASETALAVLVDGEPVVTGLTKCEAERRRHWLEFMAHPDQRAAAP